MQLNSLDIIKSIFTGMWAMKELYFILLGVAVLSLALRVVVDLLSRRSQIKWFLGKKQVQDLQKLTPSQFEEYIAELFQSLGYKTRVTGKLVMAG
jgi:HJR/Mrr/RecB family endonuclease